MHKSPESTHISTVLYTYYTSLQFSMATADTTVLYQKDIYGGYAYCGTK